MEVSSTVRQQRLLYIVSCRFIVLYHSANWIAHSMLESTIIISENTEEKEREGLFGMYGFLLLIENKEGEEERSRRGEDLRKDVLQHYQIQFPRKRQPTLPGL